MILIGTIHDDFLGPSRLERLLVHLKPSRLSVEFSESVNPAVFHEELHVQRARYQDALANLDLYPCVREVYAVGAYIPHYEFETAYEYARSTGAQLFLVDHPDLRNGVTENWTLSQEDIPVQYRNPVLARAPRDYILNKQIENTDVLYRDPAAAVAAWKQMWERLSQEDRQAAIDQYEHDTRTAKTLTPEIREAHLERRLREVLPDVHICGVGHFAPGLHFEYLPEGLPVIGERLSDIITKKIPLIDADAL